MVVETRVSSIWSKLLMDGHDGSTPLEEGPSYVRFVCKVTVQRASSRLGVVHVEHAEPMRICEAKHLVDDDDDDPSACFLDHDRIRRIAWHELAGMPGLREFDLSPSN
jgi:hypothetical protein